MKRPLSETLLGVHEVADRLCVSQERVRQLRQLYSDFPEPIVTLRCGRIWLLDDVEAWSEAHPNRKPGRPRKPK